MPPADIVTLTYQSLDDNVIGLGDFTFRYILLNSAPVSFVTLTYQTLDDNVIGLGDSVYKYTLLNNAPVALTTLTHQNLDDNIIGLGDFVYRYILLNNVPASLITLTYQTLDHNIIGLGDFIFRYTFERPVPPGSIVTTTNKYVLVKVGNYLHPVAVVGDKTIGGKEIASGSAYLFVDTEDTFERAIARVGDPLVGGGAVDPICGVDWLLDDALQIAYVNDNPTGAAELSIQALSAFYTNREDWNSGTKTQVDVNTIDGSLILAKSNGTYYTYGEDDLPSFDSLETSPGWSKITWGATTPTSTLVRFQMNFSDDNSNWSGWGATSGGVFTLDAWFTTPNSDIVIPSLGAGSGGGRYIRVRCRLETTDTTKTPELMWVLCKNP